jgi:hypothetical protein
MKIGKCLAFVFCLWLLVGICSCKISVCLVLNKFFFFYINMLLACMTYKQVALFCKHVMFKGQLTMVRVTQLLNSNCLNKSIAKLDYHIEYKFSSCRIYMHEMHKSNKVHQFEYDLGEMVLKFLFGTMAPTNIQIC